MASPLDTISRNDFTTLEGRNLVLETRGMKLDATLTEVGSLGCNRPTETGGRESFRFVLRVGNTVPASQGCYTLHHPQLGPIEVFLVPIARTADGLQLEAVFNFA